MKAFLKSFGCAVHGIRYAVIKERNIKIQLVCALLVIIAAIVLHVSFTEWAVLLICCGGVLTLEIVNTAIETVSDVITETYRPAVKICKDAAAGAVLLFSVFSFVVGCIIFIPRFIQAIFIY